MFRYVVLFVFLRLSLSVSPQVAQNLEAGHRLQAGAAAEVQRQPLLESEVHK